MTANGRRDLIRRLKVKYCTYHNLAEKKKTMSINHTAVISINYTTQHTSL